MSDSRRQQLFDAVISRLEGIDGTGNYNFDLSADRVFPWRDILNAPPEASELPILAVRDPRQVTIQRVSGVHEHTLSFEILGAVSSATEPDAEGRKLMADVTESIRSDRKWGGLAFDTDPGGDEMGLLQSGKKVVGFILKFNVKYRTKSFDPYNTQ